LGYLTTINGVNHYGEFGEFTINNNIKYIKWIEKDVELPSLEEIKK